MSLLVIDGVSYDVGIIKVTRTPNIEKNYLGATLDGTYHNEPVGTYFDYNFIINAKSLSISEYDALYQVLTAPVEYHTVTVPYGQNAITFDADISIGSDEILANYSNFRKWGELKITCKAIKPQRSVV